MSLVGTTTEKKIWNYLKAQGLNDFGTAGLMGNLQAESGLISTNLQNTFEKKLGYRWRYSIKAISRNWRNPPNPNWPKK